MANGRGAGKAGGGNQEENRVGGRTTGESPGEGGMNGGKGRGGGSLSTVLMWSPHHTEVIVATLCQPSWHLLNLTLHSGVQKSDGYARVQSSCYAND